MKTVPEIKQELKNALPVVSIKDVFLAIKKYLPERAEKFNSLLLLEGRYRDIEQKMLQGVLNLDEIQVETNKIRADLLTFIDSLEEEDFQEKTGIPAEPSKPKTGKILYRIPDTMQVNEESKCIIRVAFTEEALLEDLEVESIDQIKSIRISEVMAAQIIDPNESQPFKIRTFSEEIQFVDEEYFTEWLFYVMPLLQGTFNLILKVSVIELINGQERKRDIVMEEKVVITTEVVAEETPFKSADYDFVAPGTAAPNSSPAQEKSKRKVGSPLPSVVKAFSSLTNVILIIGLSLGVMVLLNNRYSKNIWDGGSIAMDEIPSRPDDITLPPPPPAMEIPSAIGFEPEVAVEEASYQTITEYKDELIAYVAANKADQGLSDKIAALRNEIQYLEYQEALLDSTSVEVIDYLDKYAKDSLTCLYCRQAVGLKTYRLARERLQTVQKIDGLIGYLQQYPNGHYKLPAIQLIKKFNSSADFPPVMDTIKWDTEMLQVSLLAGQPPFQVSIRPSKIGTSSKPPADDPRLVTEKKVTSPFTIPFKVPDLKRNKYDLVIKDVNGHQALIPLDSTTVFILSKTKVPENTEGLTDQKKKDQDEKERDDQVDLERLKKEKEEKEKEKRDKAEKERKAKEELERLEKEKNEKEQPTVPTPNPTSDKVLSQLSGEILVKKGSFTMGSTANGADKHEQPAHLVNIKHNFYIQQTETTFQSYDAYCQATGTPKPSDNGWGRGSHPVVNVSWVDAVKYCNWLSSKYPQLTSVYDLKENGKVVINETANGFRLPTEAEWEYAAQGGHQMNDNLIFAGSDDWKTVAYYHESRTGTVKSKKPNALGIYDMSGNAYEWTQDCWKDNYNGVPTDGSAYLVKGSVIERTIRGGRFNSSPTLMRVTHRTQEVQNTKREGVSFRVVRFAE